LTRTSTRLYKLTRTPLILYDHAFYTQFGRCTLDGYRSDNPKSEFERTTGELMAVLSYGKSLPIK
jgi:hypothetical protein